MPLTEIDRQLLDRCLKREPGAWNDFVDRYLGLIYHVIHHVEYARSLDLSEADTEDLAAEIFLALVEDDFAVLRRFRGASSLPTYLTVVARRICIKQAVKRHREAELGHVHAHRANTSEEESTTDAEPAASAEELDRILRDLPERDAEVVRLYHLKYLNYRQISKQLGIPENSIGPILNRARQRLQTVARQRNSG